MLATPDIDDDALAAARAQAACERASIGDVLPAQTRNGIPLLGSARNGGRPVTLDLVNQLRDEWS